MIELTEIRTLSLREIQLASLEILKVIDSICRANGFRYYLAYGTLIGAVRHHGFIPWDDDIDIQMPRPDYDLFLQYFDGHREELKPLVAILSSTIGLTRLSSVFDPPLQTD